MGVAIKTMRLLRPVLRSVLAIASNNTVQALALLFLLGYASDALAQNPPPPPPPPGGVVGGGGVGAAVGGNLRALVTNTADNTNTLGELFNYACYVMGAVLMGLGLSEFRRVVDGTGGGSMTWRHPVAKLFFGAFMVALPFTILVIKATLTGGLTGAVDLSLLKSFGFIDIAVDTDGIADMIKNGIFNIGIAIQFSAFAAFFIGVWFMVRGLQLTKAHIENPGNAPLPEGLKRLGVGGLLLSMPLIAEVVKKTFGSTSTTGITSVNGWNATLGSPTGLDGMLAHFVHNIANPAYFGIEAFCYIAGIVMILFAMQRLVRTAQDGPRGPLGFGTIVTFIVAGILLSFPQFLRTLDLSIVGQGGAMTNITVPFMSTIGATTDQIANVNRVFSAVLAFMAVVGFLSVVRGLFMLKVLADGGQATLMQVVVHLVAGSLAINLGAFINAVQTSLGLSPTSFALVFS